MNPTIAIGQRDLTTDVKSPLPRRANRAGPEFFAKNSVTQLREWPREALSELGPLPFPMRYDQAHDRYNATEWSGSTADIGRTLAEADEVIVIGNQRFADQLQTLQIVLANALHCPVELLQCWDDRSPGHVRSSSPDSPPLSETGSMRVIVTLGRTPTPHALGFDAASLLVCITDEVIPPIFDVSKDAVVLPVSSGGWKLSHIAFHRLLDIETEQAASYQYGRMYEDKLLMARPLCSILALVLRAVRHHNDRPG